MLGADMETTRTWLLPGVVAATQLFTLLLAPSVGLPAPGLASLIGVLTAAAIEFVALGRRRSEPVQALVGTLVAALIGSLTGPDHFLDIGALIALYSVAVRRGTRVTLVWTALAVVCEWARETGGLQGAPVVSFVFGYAITAVLYVACSGLGQARRWWLAEREVAARRLGVAQDDRHRVAHSERHRLARELHDVSAHHLTSVVITADAASRLRHERPELVAEALSLAERSGQEALGTLHRLVALMGEGERPDPRPMTGRIQDVVAAFSRLGRPIVMDLPPDLAGPAAEAVFGIVREALTNALRYATGAAVWLRVRRTDGALELTVHNDAPRGVGRSPAAGLGSGRGIEGMRERAAAVGGRLSAGPDATGGWTVTALLPDTAGPSGHAAPARRRDLVAEQRLTDGALFVVAAGLPLVTLLAAAEDGSTPVGPAFGVTMVVLSVLHALPLVWRRRAPWPVLWAVAATAWLWPLARDAGLLPSVWTAYLHFAALAEVFAVYALAVYGRGVRTWPAILVAACGLAGALAATGAVDGSLSGEDASVAAVSEAVVALTIMGGVVLALVWVVGLAVRRRRLRVVLREEEEITGSEQEAADAVASERRRIATGLQEAVLHRTAAVPELAGRGELEAVAAAARSALEAMRELLHRLRETAPEDGQPRRPGDPDRADTLRVSDPTEFRGELSGGVREKG